MLTHDEWRWRMGAVNQVVVKMIQRLNDIRDTGECSEVMRDILVDDVKFIYRLVNDNDKDGSSREVL